MDGLVYGRLLICQGVICLLSILFPLAATRLAIYVVYSAEQ